jgi:hypothetical protein
MMAAHAIIMCLHAQNACARSQTLLLVPHPQVVIRDLLLGPPIPA